MYALISHVLDQCVLGILYVCRMSSGRNSFFSIWCLVTLPSTHYLRLVNSDDKELKVR